MLTLLTTMLRLAAASTTHTKLVVTIFIIHAANRCDAALLGVNVCGLALPSKRGLRTVGLTRPTEYLFLDHDMAVAAHAFKVLKERFRVMARHVVDSVHVVLFVSLRILIDLVVQIECLLEHLVLLLIRHFAEALICSFTLAQVDGLNLA